MKLTEQYEQLIGVEILSSGISRRQNIFPEVCQLEGEIKHLKKLVAIVEEAVDFGEIGSDYVKAIGRWFDEGILKDIEFSSVASSSVPEKASSQ